MNKNINYSIFHPQDRKKFKQSDKYNEVTIADEILYLKYMVLIWKLLYVYNTSLEITLKCGIFVCMHISDLLWWV